MSTIVKSQQKMGSGGQWSQGKQLKCLMMSLLNQEKSQDVSVNMVQRKNSRELFIWQ